jgi:ParB-like chromosome segregation protein Spo0J
MSLNEFEFHPLANLFPIIEGTEFDELVADIRQHGVREIVWLYDGKILDGRNRYRAAQIASVPCPTMVYKGDNPIAFVVSLNLRRRHLDESQRALVAAKLANMRQGERSDLAPNGAKLISQTDAAELLNVSRRNVQRARQVIDDGADELVGAVERGAVSVSLAADIARNATKEEQREILAACDPKEIVAAARTIKTSQIKLTTGEFEWYTPAKYIEPAREVLGDIDLDPASCMIAQKTVQARRFFTIDDDGLKQEWHGRVWMNPPYARGMITEFTGKLVSEYKAGRVTSAIMVVHSTTDTSWFQAAAHVASAICFTDGRTPFEKPDATPPGSGTLGSAFFYFGPNADRFAEVFGQFGFVVPKPYAIRADILVAEAA